MNSNRKYYLTIFSSIFCMFLWIFVTVILTGGREIYEFTKRDSVIFGIFILTELATIGVMCIALVKLTKNTQKSVPQVKQVPKTKYERKIHRRGIWLIAASYLIAFVFVMLGIISTLYLTPSTLFYCKIILTASFIVYAFLILGNLYAAKHHIKKLEQMKVGEAQQFVIGHRDSAGAIASKKLTFLKRHKTLTDFYAIVLFVFGILVAFSAGAVMDDTGVTMVFYFLASFLCLAGLSRIRFSVPSIFYDEDKTYVAKDDYPELYALAQKAADALHCDSEIRIAILGECNAGIAKTKNIYSIQLGAILLNLLSQEELYTVLLHEFAHIATNTKDVEKTFDYYNWVYNGGNPNFYAGITSLLFLYLDRTYLFHHSLYQYAASLANETNADRIMGTLGDAKHAASALLKIKYYDMFIWEKGTYDEPCFYASEELTKTFLEEEVAQFKNSISKRKADWNTLIDSEILSRSASHPTLKMRLETLGISSLELIDSHDTGTYNQECLKAIQQLETLIYEENQSLYEENRKHYYLDPLQKVTDWENAGRPLIPEEYSDIDQSLRQLGRNMEALQLCERAIAELHPAASCYAYYMKGCFLLHSYDASGIDLIYHAIEQNNNYINDGLDVIGEFCCLVGREDDLETYRQRGVEIAQKKKDVYDEANVLRKSDNLVGENLPNELHNGIMQYITSIAENHIQKIYLVRKTITSDFFTSAFVIHFEKSTSEEVRNQVFHKIFSYLDTCSDWQFSLFDYDGVKSIKFDDIPNSCFYSK